ncbi:Halomucin [Labeo rohita]|uniref:Halomucin n=1 Tax=Labeo rohita TaxID=84645 RepID=A0ABQ8LII6_LABRO|nr:Halomucin [Labeo rohita]
MPSFQFLRLFGGQLTKMSIVISVPLSFLLVGLQSMIDVKFSCPCKTKWNSAIATVIFVAPAIVALVIMLFLLRPFKYKYEGCCCHCDCCCQEKNNSKRSHKDDNTGTSHRDYKAGTSHNDDNAGTSHSGDNTGTSHRDDKTRTTYKDDNAGTSHIDDNERTPHRGNNTGTSQGQDKKETFQSETNELEENLGFVKASFVCLVPSLVWICLCFIDGDYLACGLTKWNGHYACDKELHPNCLNWCKPDELSQGKTETEYERTRELIVISKITGYVLAIALCIGSIIFVSLDFCRSGKVTWCGCIDIEGHSHRRQDPGTGNQQRNDNSENAPENQSLIEK